VGPHHFNGTAPDAERAVKNHRGEIRNMKKLTALLSLSAFVALLVLANPSAAPAQTRREQPDMTIDAATRTEVIETALKRLNEMYVFPEVAKKMEQSIRERVAKKEYDEATSATKFAELLTAHLQEVSRDKHLNVRYSHEPVPQQQQDDDAEPTAEQREKFRQFGKSINFGFERVERLAGNIGYVEMRGFFDASSAAETLAAAMNFLQNTDAIIFDLRRNGGGDPKMVALVSSYLFGEEPVHLNSLYWRKGDRTEDFFTLKEVAGKRYGNKDVYVLTSNRTFSAAEEFTYNLKNLKRATIVGETTGGGANPGTGVRLARHFGMFLPTGRAVSPITKTNWEGTGVKPDVEVSADLALKTAHIAALRKAAERTTDERLKGEHLRYIEQLQKELSGGTAKK
jgi:hypothetical protein